MIQATVRAMEPESGGADVFLEKKVSHAVVKLAMALAPQPGKYLQTAPGDTALYKGDGLGLAQYIGQRPLEDRSLVPLVTVDSLRASLVLADGGAVLAPEQRGVLVLPSAAEAAQDARAAGSAAGGKAQKKEKKEKRSKDKKEKEKKDKKEKRAKEKSKDKEKSSGKRKRSEEKD